MVFAQEALVELKESDGNLIPAIDLLRRAAEKLEEIAQIDSEAEEMSQSMKDILFRLEDVIEKLRSYLEQLDFNPDYARQVEERHFALLDLMRKYGDSLDQVCAFREEAAAEMENLQGAAQQKEFLEKEYRKTQQEYDLEAKKLSSLRREGQLPFPVLWQRSFMDWVWKMSVWKSDLHNCRNPLLQATISRSLYSVPTPGAAQTPGQNCFRWGDVPGDVGAQGCFGQKRSDSNTDLR